MTGHLDQGTASIATAALTLVTGLVAGRWTRRRDREQAAVNRATASYSIPVDASLDAVTAMKDVLAELREELNRATGEIADLRTSNENLVAEVSRLTRANAALTRELHSARAEIASLREVIASGSN